MLLERNSLIEVIFAPICDKHRQSPLIIAMQFKYKKTIKILLEWDYLYNYIVNKQGQTPPFKLWAVALRHAKPIFLLDSNKSQYEKSY